MTIATRLEQLRLRYPDCRTLALSDLTLGLVLCASTQKKLPQEQLDWLCATAGQLLDGLPVPPIGARSPFDTAILIEGGDVQVFVRRADGGDDAICCDGALGLDTAGIASGALDVLDELAVQS